MTEATEHTALLSAERGKAVASHLCQYILQRAEEKGHFFTCWVPNKVQFIFPWSSQSEK